MAGLEHEVFAVFFLDSQLRLIQYRELFQGTLNQTAVYPREVVKEVLRSNAGAVILAHNHPSGKLEPSQVDRQVTEQLKKALELIDVRVLDHLIVGPSANTTSYSFAEHGDLLLESFLVFLARFWAFLTCTHGVAAALMGRCDSFSGVCHESSLL